MKQIRAVEWSMEKKNLEQTTQAQGEKRRRRRKNLFFAHIFHNSSECFFFFLFFIQNIKISSNHRFPTLFRVCATGERLWKFMFFPNTVGAPLLHTAPTNNMMMWGDSLHFIMIAPIYPAHSSFAFGVCAFVLSLRTPRTAEKGSSNEHFSFQLYWEHVGATEHTKASRARAHMCEQ